MLWSCEYRATVLAVSFLPHPRALLKTTPFGSVEVQCDQALAKQLSTCVGKLLHVEVEIFDEKKDVLQGRLIRFQTLIPPEANGQLYQKSIGQEK